VIEILTNKFDPAVLREHRVLGEHTLEEWLISNCQSYERRDVPPISIEVNGALIAPAAWPEFRFGPDDAVSIWIEPKGTDPISITIAAIKGLQAVMKLIMPRIKMPKTGSAKQGSSLSAGSAKANQVKYGDPVREVAGEDEIFPDYIVEPRRLFKTERDEWQRLMLCVGVGEFHINDSDIKIGNTPIISLGANATYKVYPPGADLSAEPAAEWWYQTNEVGSTSTGTSGLDLKTTFTVPQAAAAQAYQFNGTLVSIPAGAGSFPTGWASGMIVRIDAAYQYTVASGAGVGGRDVVSGPLAQLRPFAGMLIEVSGANQGRYVVNSYTAPAGSTSAQMTLNTLGGAPVSGLQSGAGWAAIGYQGLRYRISAASDSQLSVQRITDTGRVDSDWPGFDYLQSNSALITLDSSTLEGDWSGPFALCPPAEKATRLAYSLMFTSGLAGVDKKGNLFAWSVQYEFQYRDMDVAGAWTSTSETITAATLDQLGYTREITLPYAMRPEGRMRRVGAKSTSTSVQDNVQWYDMRALLPSPKSYPNWTTIAISAAGGGKLAAQSENRISVVATRKLPVLDQGRWTEDKRPTRDIAPWLNYVTRKVGYADPDWDLEELLALDQVWKGRGDTFDLSIEEFTTVKEALNAALAAGFSELTIGRGRLRPVRDQLREGPDQELFPKGTQGYSAQNLLGPLKIAFNPPDPADDHDGIDVEYKDRRTRSIETIPCRLPGDQGIKVEKVKAVGVSDPNKAYQLGMRRRSEARYRRWTYTFDTELDGNNSEYMSLAAVSDDTPGRGQSALLLSVFQTGTGLILESSEPFIWEASVDHAVGIRRQDGTMSGPWRATRIDEFHLSVQLIDFKPDTSWDREPPHLLFGPYTRYCHKVLISKSNPKGLESVSLQGFNYDARVYAFDDSLAPAGN
jgi:hypothetical protein